MDAFNRIKFTQEGRAMLNLDRMEKKLFLNKSLKGDKQICSYVSFFETTIIDRRKATNSINMTRRKIVIKKSTEFTASIT